MSNELIETKAFKGMKQGLTDHNRFKFAVGGIYEISPDKEIELCESGFHACINLLDCFDYDSDKDTNRFFEVTIFGDYVTKGSLICARKIRIDRELILKEVLNGEYTTYNGTKKFYKNGYIHRDGDLPAIIYPDGTKVYYSNEEIHRDGDLPALIKPDGSMCYYDDGQLHRDGDLPAVVFPDGTQIYYKNGRLHRDGDLPAMVYPNGTMCYYKHGELHRDDNLPAIINPDGTMAYYKNNRLHRDGDLPAVINPDGTKEYYKHGREYTP